MKHCAICLAALALLLAGCRTTEENYQAAYAIARDKVNDGLTNDEIAALAQEQVNFSTTYKGERIPGRAAYVKPVEPSTEALKYNVIVAQFKQKFNATSVYKRLKEAGFEHAAIMTDAEQNYYVAALTTSNLDEAAELYHRLASKPSSCPVAMKVPCPWLLRNPYLK